MKGKGLQELREGEDFRHVRRRRDLRQSRVRPNSANLREIVCVYVCVCVCVCVCVRACV